MKKLYVTFFVGFLLSSYSAFTQNILNQYQYAIIPTKFSFQDKPNEYNINQILKTSLEKYGFIVFFKGDTISSDISACELLHIDMDKSGFMANKIRLIFNDCYGKSIYTSIEGKSRIKEIAPNLYEAIRLALKDKNITNHQYASSVKKTIEPSKPNLKTNHSTKPNFVLEFLQTAYEFYKTSPNHYNVYVDKNKIGELVKQTNNQYILSTKKISGTGTFDEFGNFNLTRINPVNKIKIKDVMARVR